MHIKDIPISAATEEEEEECWMIGKERKRMPVGIAGKKKNAGVKESEINKVRYNKVTN